jgi:hypothetical protein
MTQSNARLSMETSSQTTGAIDRSDDRRDETASGRGATTHACLLCLTSHWELGGAAFAENEMSQRLGGKDKAELDFTYDFYTKRRCPRSRCRKPLSSSRA